MDSTIKDYEELSKRRYTSQFENKPNFSAWMRVLLSEPQEAQEIALSLLTLFDIDKSFGKQLDNIGDIVGQPRELVGLETYGFFGFEKDASALSFGSVGNGDGGYFYSLKDTSSGIVKLKDNLYRNMLKVKIISNNTGVTPEDLIEATKILFEVNDVILEEIGNASYTLSLGSRAWSDPHHTNFPNFDETVLAKKFLPKPLGVSVKFVNP